MSFFGRDAHKDEDEDYLHRVYAAHRKIYREWFVSFLRERGYDVEYWNLSPFLQGLKDENGLQDDRITRFFYSFREFEAGLAALKTDATVCVMLMGYGERSVPVYRLMTKYRRRMVYLAWGYIPWQRARRLKEKVSLFANPARLAKKLFFKIRAVAYRKLGLVAPYDVVFSSSPSIAAANFNVRKIVPINSLDYDRFIEGARISISRRLRRSPYFWISFCLISRI